MRATDLDHAKALLRQLSHRGGRPHGDAGGVGAEIKLHGLPGYQAQVREGATLMSTSTLNFPKRLGKNTNVFLGSAVFNGKCININY